MYKRQPASARAGGGPDTGVVAWSCGIKFALFGAQVLDDLRYALGGFALIFAMLVARARSAVVAALAFAQIVAALGVACVARSSLSRIHKNLRRCARI